MLVSNLDSWFFGTRDASLSAVLATQPAPTELYALRTALNLE